MSARQSLSALLWAKRTRGGKDVMTPLGVTFNDKLNASETMLRGRIGDQKVEDLIRQFKAAATADPKLFKALYAKRDPYRWLAQYWAPRHERTQNGVEVLRGLLTQEQQH